MPAAPKHRDAIVQAAATLFRRKGYAGTGLADIVALSHAPKGSLYHYFPAGKAQIAEATVRLGAENTRRTLEELAAQSPSAGALVEAYADRLAGWLEQSSFTSGNAITTTLLELAPVDGPVTAAGRDAFVVARGVIAARLAQDGVAKARAEGLAALAISAVEGTLVQARVEQSGAIIRQVAAEVAAAFAAA